MDIQIFFNKCTFIKSY